MESNANGQIERFPNLGGARDVVVIHRKARVFDLLTREASILEQNVNAKNANEPGSIPISFWHAATFVKLSRPQNDLSRQVFCTTHIIVLSIPSRAQVKTLDGIGNAYGLFNKTMTTFAGRELTLRDLVIAPDLRSATFGFIRYELVRRGEEESEWHWQVSNSRGLKYPRKSFKRLESAVDELIATVENLKVTVPFSER